jgi:hypothetical protein
MEVEDGVDVGRVVEVGHEHQARPLLKRRTGRGVKVHVGDDLDGDVRRQLAQRLGVVDADGGQQVGLRVDGDLPLAGALRGGQRLGVTRQLGAAPLAQVVHVVGVDDDPRRRRQRPDVRQVQLSDAVEVQVGDVEAVASEHQLQIEADPGDRVAGGAQAAGVQREDLNADGAQLLHIAFLPDPGPGHERHVVALLDHDLDVALQAQRSRLPVVGGKLLVDDEDGQLAPGLGRTSRLIAGNHLLGVIARAR